MKKKVYQLQNALVIEDFVTGEKEFIGLNFFSFETNDSASTIMLIDSSIDKRVTTISTIDFLDETGTPVGDLSDIETYLSGFSLPLGSVSLEAGAKVEPVDNIENALHVGNGEGDVPSTRGFFLMGEDSSGVARRVRTESDGRLISSASVTNPPGTTTITESYLSNVSTTIDNDYVIPNGEVIVIQQFSGGAEGDVDGSKVELFVFEDGTKTTGELLSVVYVNGSNGTDSINKGFVGNGSRLVTIRRSRLAGSGKEIFGKWQGYK